MPSTPAIWGMFSERGEVGIGPQRFEIAIAQIEREEEELAAAFGVTRAHGGAGGQQDHFPELAVAKLGRAERGFDRGNVVAGREERFRELALRLGVDGVFLHGCLPFPDRLVHRVPP